jgi:phage-related protein
MLEVVPGFDVSSYRAVYVVGFRDAVYVLHAFQKKSKRGIATPKAEIDLIKRRLVAAEQHYEATYGKGAKR